MKSLTDINRRELARRLIGSTILAEVVLVGLGFSRGLRGIAYWMVSGLFVGLAFGILRYFEWHSRQQTREEEERAIARFPQLR